MRLPPGAVRAALLARVERAVDRLPKAAHIVRGEYGRTIATTLQALLPERSAAEREAIVRGVVRHLLLNRVVDVVLHAPLPGLAVALARAVPAVASRSAATALRDSTTPLVITSGHFGPLFLQLLILKRLLPQRPAIVVLRARAPYLSERIPFIRRIGYEFVVDDPHVLLKLRRALRKDPRTVVMFAMDHTHRGRHAVPFLGGTLMSSNGVGLLADIGNARVVTSFWEWNRGLPRLVLEGPYCVDRSLAPTERRRRFRDLLYAILEARIAAVPEQWSGWHYVAANVVRVTPREAVS